MSLSQDIIPLALSIKSYTIEDKKPFSKGFFTTDKYQTSLNFHYQSHTLSGSDLLYHFVGFPPHSRSPIPRAEHLLLLR